MILISPLKEEDNVELWTDEFGTGRRGETAARAPRCTEQDGHLNDNKSTAVLSDKMLPAV